MALEDLAEAVDALATAAVHLVGHRRRADLTGLETFGGQLVAGHEAQRCGEVCGSGTQLHERTDNVEIERPGVHLTDAVHDGVESQVCCHGCVECGDVLFANKRQHVLLGADRTLDAS